MFDTLLTDSLGTIAYFSLAAVILLIGFVVLDLLTPDKLHELVFVHHKPNAGMIAAAQQIALGVIIVSAILQSSDDLVTGLVDTAVYALVALVLQCVALVVVELLVPGRFRDLVVDPRLRPGTVVVSVTLVVIAAINAASMS